MAQYYFQLYMMYLCMYVWILYVRKEVSWCDFLPACADHGMLCSFKWTSLKRKWRL